MTSASMQAYPTDVAADEGMDEPEASEETAETQEIYEDMESTNVETANTSEMGNGGK